jgi:hypothetical protein
MPKTLSANLAGLSSTIACARRDPLPGCAEIHDQSVEALLMPNIWQCGIREDYSNRFP